ncbi:MAG: hypothetical protein WDW36_004236 [Sanguina aurantia]
MLPVRLSSKSVRPVSTVRVAAPRCVIVRADPVKVGRSYNENDDKISGPSGGATGKPATTDGALYADMVSSTPQSQKPKSNLSKEMKKRLREEYTGLGGAEGKVEVEEAAQTLSFPRRMIVAAASVSTAATSQATLSPSSADAAVLPAGGGSSKWVIDSTELLTSTDEQRFWTFGPMGLMAATFIHATSQVTDVKDAATLASVMLLSYVLSDLGTGVYHWGVDNYGGPSTPLFGRQIAAFQGHHQRPWTITQREFSNNLHQVFKPAVTPAAALFLLSFVAPMEWNGFSSSFLFLVCMSQQFHAWSHMKKSELPEVVLALQERNILISRKAHGAHHRSPFEGNYCIVSGLWNPLLDDSKFFRKLEAFFQQTTGVEPRCWAEPELGWEELERPAAL